MTPQEAKALFEEDLKGGKCNDTCPECNARELAIKALEKQIPKKVVFESDLFELRYCPCCKVRFIDWGMRYCGECGQAIDWSDTE